MLSILDATEKRRDRCYPMPARLRMPVHLTEFSKQLLEVETISLILLMRKPKSRLLPGQAMTDIALELALKSENLFH